MKKVIEKEMHDEIVGVLTAISIVSKRLATRLKEQGAKGKEEHKNKEDKCNEQDKNKEDKGNEQD